MLMKVAVGSANPVKIQAVREVFQEVFGEKVEITSVKVDSGVPTQPFKDCLLYTSPSPRDS